MPIDIGWSSRRSWRNFRPHSGCLWQAFTHLKEGLRYEEIAAKLGVSLEAR